MPADRLSPDTMRSLLQDVFPVECRLVGTENLDDLCAGRLSVEDDGGAFRMTSGESLAILANAVTVTAFLWQLFSERRARRMAKREADDKVEAVELLLQAEIPESRALARDKRVALIVAVRIALK